MEARSIRYDTNALTQLSLLRSNKTCEIVHPRDLCVRIYEIILYLSVTLATNETSRVVKVKREHGGSAICKSWLSFPFRPTSDSSRRLQSVSGYAEKGTVSIRPWRMEFLFSFMMDNYYPYIIIISLLCIVNSVVLYFVKIEVYLFFFFFVTDGQCENDYNFFW